MEATAHAKFQRYGPRKVAQTLSQIRGKSVWQAYQLLPMVPRVASGLVVKAIKSAEANLNVRAGKKLDPKTIKVTQAWVGQGPTQHLRRVMPAPQGRANTFKRKVCHVTIVVTEGE